MNIFKLISVVGIPKETNLKIIEHISNINLICSDKAREYLLR